MRLCDPKTRQETGFDHVVRSIGVATPFGMGKKKAIRAFAPGEEAALIQELDRLEAISELIVADRMKIEVLLETLAEMKDIDFTLQRSRDNVLTVVELFEVKTLLLQMGKIKELLHSLTTKKTTVPKEYIPEDTERLLDYLDPDGERINAFYIYDTFSTRLAGLRKERRELEMELRRLQKEKKKSLEIAHGISMTPKFEVTVSKSDSAFIQKLSALPELYLAEEDYVTAVFRLKESEETSALRKRMDGLTEAIEEEELAVRETLSRKVGAYSDLLRENCNRIGDLDLALGKAQYAIKRNCIRPEIIEEHLIDLINGRNLLLEEILENKGKKVCPVTISLKDGVACITGANMGGKTVSLKLVGLCAMLAQHGFFVPCEEARVGLSSYIHILVGDSQNLQRGLSSFGSEMEELKAMMDRSKDRALLLIDELASGTNPVEGMALTRSLVDYFSKKPYITLITTHFDNVAAGDNMRNLQVRGLAGADLALLEREIRYANRKQRIEVIAKYMDYRLQEVTSDAEIPKDALNIAAMLGIDEGIIQAARKHIERRTYHEG